MLQSDPKDGLERSERNFETIRDLSGFVWLVRVTVAADLELGAA